MSFDKLILRAEEPQFPGLYGAMLRFRYFVQLMPDGRHLVPGVLHQGEPPTNGEWLEVGKIERQLAKRYFAKLTPDRRLVPGLLITADKHPGAFWWEI